jgi:photosystem II protein
MQIIFLLKNKQKIFEEKTFPIIKLTKSRNGKTGTASFLFINPVVLSITNSILPIEELTLLSEKKCITTTDIAILFFLGKPFLIKSIFIFKNSNDWFDFLNFMDQYSKETGFYFSKKYEN